VTCNFELANDDKISRLHFISVLGNISLFARDLIDGMFPWELFESALHARVLGLWHPLAFSAGDIYSSVCMEIKQTLHCALIPNSCRLCV
jgi:hypothetical protein